MPITIYRDLNRIEAAFLFCQEPHDVILRWIPSNWHLLALLLLFEAF